MPQIRLIDETGAMVGLVPTSRALQMAQERGYDLVEVNPVAQPPVCKLVDFGQLKYKLRKEEAKAKKAKRVEVKGIRLSLSIGQHDLDLRRRQSEKFLAEGHKVRLELIMRGRQKGHADIARQKLIGFVKQLGPTIAVEQQISLQGGKMSLTLGVRKTSAGAPAVPTQPKPPAAPIAPAIPKAN